MSIGYGGYIPGTKPENIIGETYGKTTYKSSAKKYKKGMDLPPEDKFKTESKASYCDQARVKGMAAYEAVGVKRFPDGDGKYRDTVEPVFKAPMDPKDINKFYGVPEEEWDGLVKDRDLKQATNAFYGVDPHANVAKPKYKPETEEEAFEKFFAVEDKKASKLGDPIPGYSGVNRRIAADNVFGMTFAEARRRADESQNKITHEKHETQRMNATFMPAYKKPREEEEWS